jgi:surface protein
MKMQQLLKARFKSLLLTIFFILGMQTVSLAQDEFITTWQTSTENQQVVIYTFSGETYNYTIDWGDGTIDTNVTGNKSHTYATTVIHTVKISGTYPRITFNYPNHNSNASRIKSIEHWGINSWTSMNSAFAGCSNIVNNADDIPDLSGVTDMSSMFRDAIDIGKGTATNWNSWDTAKVTDMSYLFMEAKSFNKDISNWNTSEVTNMRRMFSNARIFNQNIGNWNTAKVTNMNTMFGDARVFNQNIGNWNTAKVTTMYAMFSGANVFNQDIGGWNTSAVTTMAFMFYDSKIFNQDIGSWNTSAVTTMRSMFNLASNFNQNINAWNTESVTSMDFMFYKARDFNQSLNSWNTSAVTSMYSMFYLASSFNGAIGDWDTSKVKYMRQMFRNAPHFNQDISAWNTSSVTLTNFMFYQAFTFNQDLSNWDMSNNKDMESMFHGTQVFNQNISTWNTENVANMESMFIGAIAFDQNIGTWNVSSVTKMTNMFNGVTLSPENYDALLIGWSAQTLKNNVTFSGGNSKYCSENAQNARTNIINTYGWTIHDLGLSVGCTALSVNDYNLDKSIVLYPNAVKEVLTIKSDNLLQKIILRDINGRVIVQVLLDNQKEKTISVSTFASGIYFAKIISDKGQLVKKIIKQ